MLKISRGGRTPCAPTIILIALVLMIAAGRSETGSRSLLGWKLERIIVRGSSLTKLDGVSIERLRLVAFHDGKMGAIPFQIDERDAKNQYILNPPSGNPTATPGSGKLVNNSELAFMAADAGDQGKVEGARAFIEMELKNPNDNSRGWAYLVDFAANPPPLSNIDYVTYKKKGDREDISTAFYVQGFNKSHVFFDDLTILPAAGGNGKNFVDKMKMRTSVSAISGKVNIARNEENFRSVVTGIKDGPIRAIRRNETQMVLLLGMKSPAVIVDGTFYKSSFEVPTLFSLPFRMDIVANDVVYRQGMDMNHTAIGIKYYNNFSREGVVFDGKMTPQEEAIAKSPVTHTWTLVAGAPGAFLYVGKWAPGTPMKVLAYYRDDPSMQDPPENEPGVMMFGYRFENILKVRNETYAFNLLNYIVPNFDGNINSIVGLAEHPIQFTVR